MSVSMFKRAVLLLPAVLDEGAVGVQVTAPPPTDDEAQPTRRERCCRIPLPGWKTAAAGVVAAAGVNKLLEYPENRVTAQDLLEPGLEGGMKLCNAQILPLDHIDEAAVYKCTRGYAPNVAPNGVSRTGCERILEGFSRANLLTPRLERELENRLSEWRKAGGSESDPPGAQYQAQSAFLESFRRKWEDAIQENVAVIEKAITEVLSEEQRKTFEADMKKGGFIGRTVRDLAELSHEMAMSTDTKSSALPHDDAVEAVEPKDQDPKVAKDKLKAAAMRECGIDFSAQCPVSEESRFIENRAAMSILVVHVASLKNFVIDYTDSSREAAAAWEKLTENDALKNLFLDNYFCYTEKNPEEAASALFRLR